MLKRVLVVVAIVATTFMLVGCDLFASIGNPIVGKWTNTTSGLTQDFYFKGDGTLEWKFSGSSSGTLNLKWTGDGKSVKLTGDGTAANSNFSFDNSQYDYKISSDNKSMDYTGPKGGTFKIGGVVQNNTSSTTTYTRVNY